MARTVRESKVSERPKNEIPPHLTEGAVLLDALSATGILDQVAKRCVIRREGGYCGGDVVLFLLAYFGSGANVGLKGFHAGALPWWSRLAALSGRVSMPSPPAMSRALAAVQSDVMRPFNRWLLTEALDLRTLLTHPAAQHRDAKGRAWHAFHFDPSSPALRIRALPAREGLPDGERRSTTLAAPGKSGRKRGEVIFTRSVLQHAGSGLWLDMCVDAGYGDPRQQLRSAIDAVVRVCDGIGHPSDLAVTCGDGQWGGIPSFASFRERNTRFVTRLSRYALFERPEIRAALRAAKWVLVPDSGSGPQRGAADLGWVYLEPSAGTLREDGSPYGPERVRLIATRYPQMDKAKKAGRGLVIEGTVYETFVTDLDEESWPADTVCAMYFGRCGQENRFAQEDRELQLDRIYAYHPAAQELAAAVGAFVWNWRIFHGFLSNPPAPDDVPSQRLAAPMADERVFPQLEVLPSELLVDVPPQDPAPEAQDSEAAEQEPRTIDEDRRAAFRDAARGVIRKILPDLFRGSHLEQRGWSIDQHRGTIVCPNLEVFAWFNTANNAKGTSPQAVFRTRNTGACAACPLKASCRRDPEAKRNYHPTLVLPPAIAAQITTPPELVPNPQRERPRPPPLLSPSSHARGPFEVTESSLLPAAARKAARRLASAPTLVIDVSPLAPKQSFHPLVAIDARRRRHGRCSHLENVARYALPAGVTVYVQVRGSVDQLALLAGLQARNIGVDRPT